MMECEPQTTEQFRGWIRLLAGASQGTRSRSDEDLQSFAAALGLRTAGTKATLNSLRSETVDRVGTRPRGLTPYQAELWALLIRQGLSFNRAAEVVRVPSKRVSKDFDEQVVPIVAQLLLDSRAERNGRFRCSIRRDDLPSVLDELNFERQEFRAAGNQFFYDDAAWAIHFYPGHTELLDVGGRVFPAIVILQRRELRDCVVTLIDRPQAFELDDKIFEASSEALAALTAHLAANGQKRQPGALARLAGLERSTMNQPVLVMQKASYEDVLRTSVALDYVDSVGETVRPLLASMGGVLQSLDESAGANVLGIDGVVLTSDGRVTLPMRSRSVALRPGQIGPSFSGDVEFTDAIGLQSGLHPDLLLREQFEELGIGSDRALNGRPEFLGLTRDLVRAGKPHLHLLVATSLTSHEVHRAARSARDRDETSGTWCDWQLPKGVEAVPSPQPAHAAVLETSFMQFLAECGDELSVQAGVTLALWVAAKTSDH